MKSIRVGCAGLIFHDNKLLLGVRGKEPNYGKWILPGGGVNFGESFEDTLTREINEECNIEIDNFSFFKTYQLINLPNEHRIIIYLKAKYVSGNLKAQSDLLDVKFLSKDEIQVLFKQNKISNFVVEVLKDLEWL